MALGPLVDDDATELGVLVVCFREPWPTPSP